MDMVTFLLAYHCLCVTAIQKRLETPKKFSKQSTVEDLMMLTG